MKTKTYIRTQEIAESISSFQQELRRIRRHEKAQLEKSIATRPGDIETEIIADNLHELGNTLRHLKEAYIAIMGVQDTDDQRR